MGSFYFSTCNGNFNSPIFIWYKIIGKYCDITKHRNYFIMLNTLFYALVPIFIMLLTNAAIICKLMYIKYKGMSHKNESVSKSSTRGSVMVVTVSLAFIILTSSRVVDNVFRLKITLSHLHNLFTATMMYLNHSINGIPYCIFGEKFRTELGKVMLLCRKKSRSENCSTNIDSLSTDTTTTNPL